MKDINKLKIAIVCDSLDQYGGGERIVNAIWEMFPSSPIFTSFYDEEKMHKYGFDSKGKKIIVPWFGKNKFLLKITKPIFFIYPLIFEKFDFSDYDLVISSSSRFAHSIITTPYTTHICYMHSPSRYAWDYFTYVKNNNINYFLKGILLFIVSYLRVWDRSAADRVDYFIANSNYTKKRIEKFYRRDSIVINPFVDIKKFENVNKNEGKYFIFLGRLIPWRKPEIIINCFNELGLSLRIIGNGDKAYVNSLKKLAKANISFYEKQTDDEVVRHLSESKALIWTGIEDFGMAPIEAQAAGKPVIAYKRGGILDTVIDGKTGIFFDEQTVVALKDAVLKFNSMKFNSEDCVENARKFRKEKFEKEFKNFILKVINEDSYSS